MGVYDYKKLNVVLKLGNVYPYVKNFVCTAMDIPSELVEKIMFGANELTIVFNESYDFCVEKYLIDIDKKHRLGTSRIFNGKPIVVDYFDFDGGVYRTDTFNITSVENIMGGVLYNDTIEHEEKTIKTMATFKYDNHDITTYKESNTEEDNKKG